jgi:hypothetical protein
MIGHLPTAIDLQHRDIARRQQMLGATVQALGEYGIMLGKPKLIGSISIAPVGEVLHCLPGLPVLRAAQIPDPDWRLGHDT